MMLRLTSPGLQWPFADSASMFVRPCYAPFFETVLHSLRFRLDPWGQVKWPLNRYLVSGQPGIGKSVFGCAR